MKKKILNLGLILLGLSVLTSCNCPGPVQPEEMNSDLVVRSVSVSTNTLFTNESVTLSAIVSNIGVLNAENTFLHWYRSVDTNITANDTEIGSNAISSLDAGGSESNSIDFLVPTNAGTYYYGACVDTVSNESNTANNCSTGERVDVMVYNSPDLIVVNVRVNNGNPLTNTSITLSATVSNAGSLATTETSTLRWRLTNVEISNISNIPILLSGESDSEKSITIDAPAVIDSYSYSICVDTVIGEMDAGNNCSTVNIVTREPNGFSPSVLSGNGDNFKNPSSGGFWSPIEGIWSDGDILWGVDGGLFPIIYAYDLASKAYLSNMDFTQATLSNASNIKARGLWSDGTTMWVVNDGTNIDKLFAYTLSNKAWDSSKDMNLFSLNSAPYDIWSDGTTMWVSQNVLQLTGSGSGEDRIYAYNLSTGDYNSNQDFTNLTISGVANPRGIWSDGMTMWVVDQFNGDPDGPANQIYAFNLSTKERVPDKDISTTGLSNLAGLWGDGTNLWVSQRVSQNNNILLFDIATGMRNH